MRRPRVSANGLSGILLAGLLVALFSPLPARITFRRKPSAPHRDSLSRLDTHGDTVSGCRRDTDADRHPDLHSDRPPFVANGFPADLDSLCHSSPANGDRPRVHRHVYPRFHDDADLHSDVHANTDLHVHIHAGPRHTDAEPDADSDGSHAHTEPNPDRDLAAHLNGDGNAHPERNRDVDTHRDAHGDTHGNPDATPTP